MRFCLMFSRCWVSNSDLLYIVHGPIHVALVVSAHWFLLRMCVNSISIKPHKLINLMF